MARLAHLLHEHLTPSRGARPGRPTNPTWVTRCKVPMSDRTVQALAALAEGMSTAERKVSPMQVAAQLLEEALGRLGEKTPAARDAASKPENKGAAGQKVRTGLTTNLGAVDSKTAAPASPGPIPIPSAQDGHRRAEGRKAGRRRKKA
jgi:hypothetical protein